MKSWFKSPNEYFILNSNFYVLLELTARTIWGKLQSDVNALSTQKVNYVLNCLQKIRKESENRTLYHHYFATPFASYLTNITQYHLIVKTFSSFFTRVSIDRGRSSRSDLSKMSFSCISLLNYLRLRSSIRDVRCNKKTKPPWYSRGLVFFNINSVLILRFWEVRVGIWLKERV